MMMMMKHGVLYSYITILVFIVIAACAPTTSTPPQRRNRPHLPPCYAEELRLATGLLQLKCIQVKLASRILDNSPPSELMGRVSEIMNQDRASQLATVEYLQWIAPMPEQILSLKPSRDLPLATLKFLLWYHRLVGARLKQDVSVLVASLQDVPVGELTVVHRQIGLLVGALVTRSQLEIKFARCLASSGKSAVHLLEVKCSEIEIAKQMFQLAVQRSKVQLVVRARELADNHQASQLATFEYVEWIAPKFLAARPRGRWSRAELQLLISYADLVILRSEWDATVLEALRQYTARNDEATKNHNTEQLSQDLAMQSTSLRVFTFDITGNSNPRSLREAPQSLSPARTDRMSYHHLSPATADVAGFDLNKSRLGRFGHGSPAGGSWMSPGEPSGHGGPKRG
ncbi:hypothetical protein SeLEV6574_g05138 [Synchytrium endobioticum]|uniref:Uncharacterized protein n=1 Tax=Synchytrium endobioticum TaxID=286115 RepID=A0A507CVZ9_9FUNG|nr:hypothetical protein SeLEV6574_g05138 [Synchytrium endobioticum]